MTGIQFVTDDKGRKVAVQIDLKRYGARFEEFWDGLICGCALGHQRQRNLAVPSLPKFTAKRPVRSHF